MSKELYNIYNGYKNVRKGSKTFLGRGKKQSNQEVYKQVMDGFKAEYMPHILETCEKIDACEDSAERRQFLRDYAKEFIAKSEPFLIPAGKTKVPRTAGYDATFYTVMYVFPLIKLAEKEIEGHAPEQLAEACRRAWGERYNCPDIQVGTYEELYNSFNTKFLGIL